MDANTPATPSSQGENPIQDQVGTPTRPTGPNASLIVLGLVAALFGTLIIVSESRTWHVNWSGFGPGAIVLIGVALVVVAAIGLVRRRDV